MCRKEYGIRPLYSIGIHLIDSVVLASLLKMGSFDHITPLKVVYSIFFIISNVIADGQYALRQASDGKYFRDNYVFHLDLPGKEKIVVLTYDRILRITLTNLRVDWDVHFHQVDTITLERAGISIVLRDGATGPFIPCPNKEDREKFFRLLAHVVEDYNSRMEGSAISAGQPSGRQGSLSRWSSKGSTFSESSRR